jgi:hypothetical protein
MKKLPNILATSEKKERPKVNNHPIGENAPNLVTLFIVKCYYLNMYVGIALFDFGYFAHF